MAIKEKQQAEIIKITEECPNVKTFQLKLAQPFSFLAGQFIMLNWEEDGKITRRAYSIASSPTVTQPIEFTIKKTPGGFASERLWKTNVGDTLSVDGPYGCFTLTEDEASDVVFIAAGSGIVPMRSMILNIQAKKADVKMLLLFSSKTEEDIIYAKEFEAWQQHDNFTCVNTLTQCQDESWQGAKGRICLDLIKQHVQDVTKKLFFICGPPAMVNDNASFLESLGVPKAQIKVEKYD